MLLKLAALGALGYAGYRYYDKNKGSHETDDGRSLGSTEPQLALAGGPMSDQARLVHPRG